MNERAIVAVGVAGGLMLAAFAAGKGLAPDAGARTRQECKALLREFNEFKPLNDKQWQAAMANCIWARVERVR
jgi:hypothetical protein